MPALRRPEGGDSGLAEGAGDWLGLGSGTTGTRSLGYACGPAMTPTQSGPGRRRGEVARRAPALPGAPQPLDSWVPTARAVASAIPTFLGFLPPGQGPSEFPQERVILLAGRRRLGGGRFGDRGRLLRGCGHGGRTWSWSWAAAAGGDGTEAAAFQTEAELFQAFEAARSPFPSLAPSLAPPSALLGVAAPGAPAPGAAPAARMPWPATCWGL